MTQFWELTRDAFQKLIQKPVMTELLLKKPPFKYLFDIILATIQKTKFGLGLYSKHEKNIDMYIDKETKVNFLKKIIKLLQAANEKPIEANPYKIVSGLQPQMTNAMLMVLHKLATSKKNYGNQVIKIIGLKQFTQNVKQNEISNPQTKDENGSKNKLTPLKMDPKFQAQRLYFQAKKYNWDNKKQNQLAKDALLKAIQLNPKYSDAYFILGVVYQTDDKNQKAIQAYMKAIQFNPKYSKSYYNAACAYIGLEKYQKAIQLINKALQYDPYDSLAYLNLGVSYENLNKHKEAIQAYKKAIQIKPLHQTPYQGLGNVYSHLKQYKEAKEAFSKAIQLNSNDYKSYNNLGIIYQDEKDYEKAQNAFKNAVSNQKNPLHITNLANIYLKRHKFQQAAKEFQEIQKIIEGPEIKQTQYIRKYQLTNGHISYIQKSLKIFKKLYGQLSNLKNTFKGNAKASKILEEQENKIYQPLIKILTQNKQENLNNNQKQLNQNFSNASKEIQNQMKKLKERLDKMEVENTNLQLKVQVIQQKMMSKEDLSQIYAKLQINGKKNQQIQKKIIQLQKKLAPEQNLQNKMDELHRQKRNKFLKYARSLYWILNSHITSYRMLSLGLVAKGDNIQQGRVGGVVKQISSFLDFAQSAPIVGGACSFINSVAKIYVDASQSVIINQIASKFSSQWNERLVSNAISQVVLLVLKSQKYCKMIEKVQKNKEQSIFDFFEIFEEQKNKVINLIQGIQDRPKQLQLELAIIDCSFIISQLARVTKEQIKKLEKEKKSENLLIIAVQKLLQERQKQQKQKQEKQKKIQKVQTSCQNCEIM